MKTILASAALAALISAPAFAQGNSETARGMADVLSGTPGIGGIAPTVSGEESRSNSGWGNAGSKETTGTSVTEGAQSQGNGGVGGLGAGGNGAAGLGRD